MTVHQMTTPVISNAEVCPGVHLMWLKSGPVASAARPGQFLMVRCGPETVLRRPLSIHRVEEDRFALLFLVVGQGTQWLAAREPGDEVDVLGPLGKGFTVAAKTKRLLLVAGGMGIAPLHFLAGEAVKQGKKVLFLYGTADAARCPVPEGAEVVAATEDGSIGHRGMITELVPEYAQGADQVFACGPVAMYRAMAQMPELVGKPVQVSLEVRMGCGLGVCYACTVKTKHDLRQVCRDGPVFELQDVLWDELSGA